ncbi:MULTISPECIES: hypothetical protein [unclassified Apibacter]|uniref:hypothetical protein n=1 Tax=unclassified Apibacter TaxID=2630820 RepID=UPI001370C857|nr:MULTISPECIES: hypothetical protein [unclassified Apibacter]MCX8677639.1 hypothetical protein [Apibacter sp. B3919]QII72926.1 hypothetical protein G8C43_09145 [Apibacter sp. B2966]
MKTTKKVDVKKFETLKTSGTVLKGGFSKSFTAVTSCEVLGGMAANRCTTRILNRI